MADMECRECGKEFSDNLEECPFCGAARSGGPAPEEQERPEGLAGPDREREPATPGEVPGEEEWEDYKPIRGFLLLPVVLLYYNTVAFVLMLFFTPTHIIITLLYSAFLMVCFYTIHAVHRRLRRAIFLFKVFFGASVAVSSLQGFTALGPADWVSMLLAVGLFAYFHRSQRVRDTFVE